MQISHQQGSFFFVFFYLSNIFGILLVCIIKLLTSIPKIILFFSFFHLICFNHSRQMSQNSCISRFLRSSYLFLLSHLDRFHFFLPPPHCFSSLISSQLLCHQSFCFQQNSFLFQIQNSLKEHQSNRSALC